MNDIQLKYAEKMRLMINDLADHEGAEGWSFGMHERIAVFTAIDIPAVLPKDIEYLDSVEKESADLGTKLDAIKGKSWFTREKEAKEIISAATKRLRGLTRAYEAGSGERID